MSKQKMIRVLVAVLVVIGLPRSECTATKEKKVEVLILGAGVSGITAANTLRKNGVQNFLILEAQSHIGGRFKQFDDIKLEEGANWIHYADEKNPLWELKEIYGLKGKETKYNDAIIRNKEKENIPYQEIQDRFDQALNLAKELQNQRQAECKPDIPLRIGLSMSGWNPKTPAEKVVEYYNIDFEYTEKPDMDSLAQIGSRGSDFFVVDEKGYGRIWREIAEPFQDKIKLNTVVKKIKYSNTEVEVETNDGKTYQADFAICTFSTGVLKSDFVKFSPPLPQWKMEAFHKVPMGIYTKIFIKFPHRFWENKDFILYAHRTRGYYPIWMDLEAPLIAPGSSILHVTVTSEVGRRVESQSEKETLEEIMTELRKVYGDDIPEAQGIFYSKWSQNPYTQGSYPNAVPGTTSDDFHNLQGNLERLYFAGDALLKDHVGFAHGAYMSAEKTAEAVLGCMKNIKNCPPNFRPTKTIVESVPLIKKIKCKLR